MKKSYSIFDKKITSQIEVNGQEKIQEKSLTSFTKNFSDKIPWDTGWMPAGLRQYSQVGHEAQMVLVLPPAINRINWGERERDKNVKTYLLAQPWRIIVTNLLNGSLLGSRMFYSPDPITSPEQPLYHQNLPNINCLGYNKTGVGWVCLYHTEDWSKLSLSEKVMRIIDRCSGVEAFNNANMRNTHGPTIYKNHKKPNFTWGPVQWEKVTEEHGVMWTLDPDLWIPVLVNGRDDQDRHVPKGKPLTLEMVMNGEANFYYDDPNNKSYRFVREGHKKNLNYELIYTETFNKTK